MRQPEDADDPEGDDECAPSLRVKDLGWIGRNIETGGEERKTEAKNQIAECFEPMSKAFAENRGGRCHISSNITAYPCEKMKAIAKPAESVACYPKGLK